MNNPDTRRQSLWTIETELLAHRLRLEQAKAAVQILPTSIECLARSIRAFEPDPCAPQPRRLFERDLSESFEYLSDTLLSAERLIENIDELLKDADHVRDQLQEVDDTSPSTMQVDPTKSAKIIPLNPDKNPLPNR
ncbi:hypothetical protein YH63_005220 [Afipia massiliensis]|uniref:Uncharacterized protein n=1 Tax=Afipia massiliensis TaxID=211460 RepID=A0A4U6BKW4_9BRAD|nr:hypothetical protein [Afipia massiliensis]TKT70859.1 hypothetical protein YH63_005220 [Afipia massiliensis]